MMDGILLLKTLRPGTAHHEVEIPLQDREYIVQAKEKCERSQESFNCCLPGTGAVNCK